LAWELGKRLTNTAIVSSDSGTITTWWARQLPVKRGQMYSVSGTLASMACGLPYTIAAQIAYPERQCVALVGDGGFTMLMGEFATAVKYQLPIKAIVVKNNVLGQIEWEQMVFLGNPEYGVDLHPIDFAAFARACGGTGFGIEDPADCGRILDQALATPGPVVVDALVDPYEPPLPAKITLEQAAILPAASPAPQGHCAWAWPSEGTHGHGGGAEGALQARTGLRYSRFRLLWHGRLIWFREGTL
jgi:pyruvate dehydrogenase (quinone)/pyruvate oxidase